MDMVGGIEGCKCNHHSPWEVLTKRGVGIVQPGDSMHLQCGIERKKWVEKPVV